jgi:predicted  nucleic acid-binding Zn-ribbon protein
MIRQMILRLLRTQDRRLEHVESAQDEQQKTLDDVKALLVGINERLGDLHLAVLKSTDEHGGAIRAAQRHAMETEARVTKLERQGEKVDELEGRVMRLEVGGNAAE